MKVKEWLIENLEKLEPAEDRIYQIELEVTNDLEVIKGSIK